jgi:hypothetical protein
MLRPDFFEPKPFLCKEKTKKTDRRNMSLHFEKQSVSILGKRRLEDIYGTGLNDTERYGQEIPSDFFKTNCGHNVFQHIVPSPQIYSSIYSTSLHKNKVYEDKLQYWRNKYLSKG